tara:strand:+ start:310 stop:825 length:516 start_codon:yes stop_codon:yes gene_type:complete
MVSDIDQFGRDTSKSNTSNLNEDKSKKILDSLAEIKKQLENKEYSPKVEQTSPTIEVKSNNDNLDFNELNSKIESLEKKINSLDYFFQNKTEVTQVDQSLDGELSIFHQLDNQSSIKQNKSLLVLESENINYKSKFKLFHFIMTINFLFLILISLIVYIKNIPIKEVLNIF